MKHEALIDLAGVGVDFPVYNAASQSLKNRLLSSVTGGAIDREHDGFVVVRGLQDITLRITPGERVGLVGHNGAGKTTMLRVLSGIYHPTQGRATIRGECISLIDISLGIDPEATGRENIRLRSAMLGFTPEQTRRHMDDIIEFSGLGGFIDMPFRTYSTGMQLRLAFAVSTTVSPQILILDEWLSTGDENFRERAEQRMRRVVDSTDILILASHTRQMLEATCDRVIWLEHGKIRRDGKTAKVLDEYFGPAQSHRPPVPAEPPKAEERQESVELRKAVRTQLGKPREIHFPEDEQPGNDVVRILACRLRNSSSEVVTELTTSREFSLEIDYHVKDHGHYLWTGCVVYDEAGSAVFWTADTSSASLTEPRAVGLWRSKLVIPGHLMAPGVVHFTVGVGDAKIPAHAHAQAIRVLPVKILDDLDDKSVRGYYRGPTLGAVRPKLDWHTNFLSGGDEP